MSKAKGFTVVEVIVVIIVLVGAGLIFWHQKAVAAGKDRDLSRKTAINAIAYSLNQVYYQKHHYYPMTLDEQTFSIIDPALLKDPQGQSIGSKSSDYRYEPTNCHDSQCQGFTLRAQLEYEADYVKTSSSDQN